MSFSVEREPENAVERSVRYATTVDSLAEAWAFVMEKLDDPLIGSTPTIKIRPQWSYSFADMFADKDEEEKPDDKLQFSVVVDGWVDITKEATKDVH